MYSSCFQTVVTNNYILVHSASKTQLGAAGL